MSSFSHKFFSIVLLGGLNPQILNHDFLINNDILPIKTEPFRSLIKESGKGKQPFTEYLSSPVVTSLTYKSISIIIDPNRYQIKDTNTIVPSKSPIVLITKKYFGEILKYTPFKLGGINFAGSIMFSDENDERSLDEGLGIDAKKFETSFRAKRVQYSSRIIFPWNDGHLELRIDKHKRTPRIGEINLNFEFLYKDIASFMDKLDAADSVYEKFKMTLKKLNLVID